LTERTWRIGNVLILLFTSKGRHSLLAI